MGLFIASLFLFLVGCASDRVDHRDLDLRVLPASEATFNPEPFISAAISLQSMGKDAGSLVLLRAANTADFYDYDKLVVLCRMLFIFRDGIDYRSPSLGHREFYGDTTFEDWPLEPITVVDGCPFWIVGLVFAGARSPDAASQYVSYCITNCAWNTFRYRQLNAGQKRSALAKLLQSPKWKRPLSDGEEFLLSSQIGTSWIQGEKLTPDEQLTSSKLAAIMQRVKPWPSSWAVANTNGYTSDDWSNLVSAATFLQRCDPTSIQKTFVEWEACKIQDLYCDYLTGTKLYLVTRIIFDLPETNRIQTWDSTWPIKWNGGIQPSIEPGPNSNNGRVYPAATDFNYFRGKYKYRNLSKYRSN